MATGNASHDHQQEPQYLFPIERLTNLSGWLDVSKELQAVGLVARPLKFDDYERGYLELLKQLTTVGEVPRPAFEARFNEMRRINQMDEHYMIVVVEDRKVGKVVGCSTLLLEYKFIHECSKRGRLEDVAVLDTHRARKIGELVVKLIVELAREAFGCYKITLDCTDELKKFYAKNNFIYASNMLAIRFDQER